MDKTKSWRKQLLVALLALVGLSACGGGSDDGDAPHEIPGLVTIELPTANPTFATSQATVNLSGSRSVTVNAITWSNSAGGSGTGTLTVQQCFFLGAGPFPCNHGWSMSVSLAVGTNAVTVKGTDADGDFGQDTITITRI